MGTDIHDPDLPLAELFRHWPEAALPFLVRRMACVGCPIAPFHTVSDACAEYALSERRFRSEIEAAVRPRRSEPPAGAAPSR